MGLLERKRERINRIDQGLYLILAVALMWPFQRQSQQGMGGHSSLGTEVWDMSSEGRGFRWRYCCLFPAGRAPQGSWVCGSLYPHCKMQGWLEVGTGEEDRGGGRREH